jgi:ribonucleoside-triphosphate reductase
MQKYNYGGITLDEQFKTALEQNALKYGDKMMKVEGMSPSQLDVCEFFKKFMGEEVVANASIDDNANVTGRNIVTMLNESHKPIKKLLSRNKLFIEIKEEFGLKTATDFLEKAINGTIYEHDSHSSSFMPYCFAFSVKPVVEKGLFFIDEMKAGKAKHWDTYNHHILEFVSYATSQTAGATGLPDYLIYAYYFYMNDSRDMDVETAERYKSQKFQEMIFSLNQPYLKEGVQSAYTNFSILDVDHLAKFFAGEEYPDGSQILSHLEGILDFQYDFLKFIGELRKEKWHTFPVISASLVYKDGKYRDEGTAKMVVRHNWEYGFNDVNIMNVEEVTSLASCCRLTSDTKELNKNRVFNSIGGSDLNVGSSKVVTMNLVRMALEATLRTNDTHQRESMFYDIVQENVELIHKYHWSHRNVLKKLINKGLLPLYTHDLMSLDDQFATVGINGVYEAIGILGGIEKDEITNWVKYSDRGYRIAEKLFSIIIQENDSTFDNYGFMSNVEQIPAESAAIKLNKKDRLYYGNAFVDKHLGKDCYVYGNQWIPLKENTSIFNRIEAGKLDNYCGGGAILHLNLGQNFNSFDDAWNFTTGLAEKGVKYFSYISIIDICAEDHSFFGETCPICGGKSVTKGIKIVGYMVKQDSYKKERKRELSERQFYNMKEG